MRSRSFCGRTCALAALCLTSTGLAGDDPFSDAVVSYDEGQDPTPGFTDPLTAIGSPERFTGEGVFPGVVSVFNPPFGVDEIVSIGAGGHLTVRFDTPVTDDPANPFGIDLLIFSNTAFIDDAYPNGVVGGVFSDNGGVVEVSADGSTWFVVAGVEADGLFPTNGYLDGGPYDETPGTVESDFTQPVDPTLTSADFLGLGYDAARALYDGAGGGAGVNLAATGLSQVSFVRISVPAQAEIDVQIDAFSDVAPDAPEIVVPDSFQVLFGAHESGTLQDLIDSDDAYIVIEQRPAFTPLLPLIRMQVFGTSSGGGVSTLGFTLEAAATALPATVPQQVRLFDFDANTWELVDERIATTGDNVVNVVVTTNPHRFIEGGTNNVRARLEWYDPGAVFSPAWGARIDQTQWAVTP